MTSAAYKRDVGRPAMARILLGVGALAILATLLPTDAAAMQFNARVSGIVTDEAGNPMEGVKVTINLMEQVVGREVPPRELTTNEEGRYFARNVRLGHTEILYLKQGYEPVRITRELKVGPFRHDVQMVPSVAAAAVERANIANAEYTAGYEAFIAGNFEEAISRLLSALVAVDDTAENADARGSIFALLGRAHFEQREFEEAADAYREWLNYAPDNPDPHIELGHTLSELGDLEAAQQHFRQALELSPDDPATLYNAGVMMVNARSVEEGIAFIERAIAVQPVYPLAYKNIGYAYAGVSEYQKAVDAFEKYLEQAPDAEDAAQIRDFIVALKELIG